MTPEEQNEKLKQIAEMSPYTKLDIPEGEQPDLLEYLMSQPEVDIDIVPLPEEDEVVEEEELTEEQKKVALLAKHIRERANNAKITPYAMLLTYLSELENAENETNEENNEVENNETKIEEEKNYDELFESLNTEETYKDIVQIQGEKKLYYYSNLIMTPYFANIAVLVEEKNESRTVAVIVRDRSKVKSSTPISHFMDYPYHYSKETMDEIKQVLATHPDYSDIESFTLRNKAEYFHSTQYMSRSLAAGLAEAAQDELSDFWDAPNKKIPPSAYR